MNLTQLGEARAVGAGRLVFGLGAALELARSLDALPLKLMLHGASVRDFGLGSPMQQAAAAAVDPVEAAVRRELAGYSPSLRV